MKTINTFLVSKNDDLVLLTKILLKLKCICSNFLTTQIYSNLSTRIIQSNEILFQKKS